MKRFILILTMLPALVFGAEAKELRLPWEHGRLEIAPDGPYFRHHDGTPFFWLGDTGWLLPQRLDRDEAAYYLKRAGEAGFNVVQVQVLNGIPSINAYGRLSMGADFDFDIVAPPGEYSYWDHLDFIVGTAAQNGIYIGLVPIWGSLVKNGAMNVGQAERYGRFLAERYKDCPNIVWIIGGDQTGDVRPDVWDALARSIRGNDTTHLITYHPRGRTTSAKWFSNREWIDFHMYQSGHRRYNQRGKDKEYPIVEGTEEDAWMYVDSTRRYDRLRPVVDGEMAYEDIPQGLHSAEEPRWTAKDVRRYAYWSTFGGAAGVTYGHNSVMQFVRPGIKGAYFADGSAKPWYIALDDEGYNQMHILRDLMLRFPAGGRCPDQSVIRDNGVRYDRLIALRGDRYILVYNHTGRPMDIDLAKIETDDDGCALNAFWMDATTGHMRPLGPCSRRIRYTPLPTDPDGVLIIADADRYPLDTLGL